MNYHWNVIYDCLAKFLLSPTRFKHICHRNKPHLSSPEKLMPFSARTKPDVMLRILDTDVNEIQKKDLLTFPVINLIGVVNKLNKTR